MFCLSDGVSALQLTEALSYLHYTHHMLHRHVCPASIFVNKRGVWKLGGLEFTGKLVRKQHEMKKDNNTQRNLHALEVPSMQHAFDKIKVFV